MAYIMDTLLPKACEFRAEAIRKHCQSKEDAIALATVLVMQAEIIWKELGGNKLVAAQLYALADRAATDV